MCFLLVESVISIISIICADVMAICAIHRNGQTISGKLSDDVTIYCEHYRLLFLFNLILLCKKESPCKSAGHYTTKKRYKCMVLEEIKLNHIALLEIIRFCYQNTTKATKTIRYYETAVHRILSPLPPLPMRQKG